MSKRAPFHGIVMCTIPYSTENPKQYYRVIKFSSVVLHSVKRSERKWPHLATFQWLIVYFIVYYLIYYWILTYLLTYCMEQSPSCEANRISTSQGIPHIFWNPKDHYGIHRHMSVSWNSSIQSKPQHHTSWRYILVLSSLLRLGIPSGLFPSSFTTKTLYTSLLSPYLLLNT